jgi:hypothetical protein
LYGDFIDEAPVLLIDALTHEQIEPSKFVQIYATIGKHRLFASADVVSNAEEVMRDVGAVYRLPNRDFSKQRAPLEANLNIIQAFSSPVAMA